MDDSVLAPVKARLREHPHPRVTVEMIESHAQVVDDPECSGAIAFDVEKRRKALGARYREQRPLAAFETYWERYCYDRQTEELRRLGTNVAADQDPTVTINSVSRLLKDHLQSLLGLLDRAWP